jgi:23S rRNA (adenine2503-C2)-methyltransferase
VIEFVESLQPPIPREQKWVLIVSTLFGCPIRCTICDAGGDYHGPIGRVHLHEQIDFMIHARFPDGRVPIPKFKIQFARMGEPTLNRDVLSVLRDLPRIYDAPGLMPCISTIAPHAGRAFLDELIDIKNAFYPAGRFQLQFSIHSTDESCRRSWMPGNIWTLQDVAYYGNRWHHPGDRKITLNFAVAVESVINPAVIADIFEPNRYAIKLTPVNPTLQAQVNGIQSWITPENIESFPLAAEFKKHKFKVIASYGQDEENRIGSNCGQFAARCNTQSSDSVNVQKPAVFKLNL